MNLRSLLGPTAWSGDSPWSRSDVRTALSTVAVGGVIMGWAWWEASGSAELDEQTGWLVVGVLGVIVILKGLISWMRTGWREVRLRRVEFIRTAVDAGLTQLARERSIVLTEPSVLTEEPAGSGVFVAVSGSTRYHRPECVLVLGKRVHAVADPAPSSQDRRPCEMCTPHADAGPFEESALDSLEVVVQ